MNKLINPDKIAFYSDLDQTLHYSTTSSKLEGHISQWPDLVVSEVYQNKPFGFMTYETVIALKEFSEKFNFIPTTTRTTEQYERIRILGVKPEYAVTNNGAKILHNGAADPDWDEHIRKEILPQSAPVDVVYDFFKDSIDNADWVINFKNLDNLFAYFVLEMDKQPDTFLEDVNEQAEGWGFKVSVQGRKAYLVPKALSKGQALEEINRRLGIEYTMAAGDSNLDKSILEVADYAVRPSHGELHKFDYSLPQMHITENIGIRAGEEIASLTLQHAYDLSGLTR